MDFMLEWFHSLSANWQNVVIGLIITVGGGILILIIVWAWKFFKESLVDLRGWLKVKAKRLFQMVYKFPYRIVNINKYIRHDKYLQDIASKDSHIAELVAPKNKPKVTHIAVFQGDDLYSSSMSRERIIYDSNEKEVVHSKLFSDSHLCMANLNSYIIDEGYNVLENVNGITGESVLFRIYLNK